MPNVKCKRCGALVEYPAGTPDYMLTFGDLNSLLMTFFVLLITMSTFDIKKFNIVLSSFQNTLGILNGGDMIRISVLPDAGVTPDEINEDFPEPVVSLQTEDAKRVIEVMEELQNSADVGNIEVFEDERGLVIQVTDEILFGGGSAVIAPAAKKMLSRIGTILKSIKGLRERPIRIEGHTDDLPVPGNKSKFGSNWELSMIRATNVLKFLITNVDISPTRLSASGYGPYKPLPRKYIKDKYGKIINKEPINVWRARNRRVDIIVLREKSVVKK